MFMHDSDSAEVLMIRTIMAMTVTTWWCAAGSHTSRCNAESRVSVSMFKTTAVKQEHSPQQQVGYCFVCLAVTSSQAGGSWPVTSVAEPSTAAALLL